jgi:class 3 adenylate cyclase
MAVTFMADLLSTDHRILERGLMQYRPFGVEPNGERIRDVTGMTVRANVEYLEETISSEHGAEAGAQALEELARLLNERITDPAYHVTASLLKNVWNSYSYEFTMYLAAFCIQISGDPAFRMKVGKDKLVSSLIATLGRPFSIPQIYKLWPHFVEKYTSELTCEVVQSTAHSAILRMAFSSRMREQFGPYLRSCARDICDISKGGLSALPEKVHHLEPAVIKDRRCIAEGDEYCEWEVTWRPRRVRRYFSEIAGVLTGSMVFGFLRVRYPQISLLDTALAGVISGLPVWAITVWTVRGKEQLIQEQLGYAEARHEELRGASLEIQELNVGLEAKVHERTLELARVNRDLESAYAQFKELAELQKEKMSRFLPSHLADMIISEDREDFLRGHRTEITAVFVDLRGFTAFSETAAPEDLMTVLRQYQAEIGPLISQYNGTLERFAGDALMIFFNDPIPVPNHAEQATRMAIAIRQRVAALQAQWSKRDIDLGLGIGIATGYATLGVIGFEGRKDYAAIGPVTNLAARLCQEAKDGQILASGRFLELVEALVRTEPLGDLNLKGFHRRVLAHNIIEITG